MDTPISSRFVSERLMRLAAAACLVVGFVISAAAWRQVSLAMETQAQRNFDRFSVHADAVIQDRVRNHYFSIAGFHSLFTVSDNVSSLEFRQHFERLRGGRWHPGLISVQYLERQPLAAPPGSSRRNDGPGQAVSGSLVIRFSEPPAPDQGVAAGAVGGIDAAARHELQTMLDATLESGLPVATPPQRLTGETLGYSIYFAVYRRGQPTDSAAQRRAALVGVVRGNFRTTSMFDDVLPQGQDDDYRVWIEDLDDRTTAGTPSVVFDSYALEPSQPGAVAESLEKTYSVVSGERAWLIHSQRTSPDFLTAAWPLTVLLSGLALTLGVWVVLRTAASQYERVSRLARQLSHEAEQSALRLRSVIDHSADGIVTIDAAAVLLSTNPAAQRMFGRSEAELVGQALPDLIEMSEVSDLRQWFDGAAAGGDTVATEREEVALRADGTRFPMAMAFNAMAGQPGLRVGILRDVTERRRIESQMQRMAQHDALTGLPNRLLLQTRLQLAIDQAQKQCADRTRAHVGLIFVDLDRFKSINDTLGHHVGDQVLKETALRLQAVVRASDTVARMGGDEFVILLARLSSASDLELVAAKILKALEQPIRTEGHELALSASVGLASWPDMASDSVALMSCADIAMYSAKRAGRNAWAWFKPGEDAVLPHKLQLENDLRHAVERGELALHFQPQFNCEGGALVGAEALLRWQHPELGPVSPAEFIPMAEESGLIVPIGQWVLHEALRHAVLWQAMGHTPLQVAVNMSPRQMDTDAVVVMVADALARTGLPAHLLTLEITESVLVRDVDSAARRLRQLADLGVLIAIDDFGVGYSSLSYLRDLPVRKLKIDRSFVHPLPDDESATRLVGAIVALGHEMQMEVVAEGVESTGQLAQLRAFRCDLAQGFLLGRPVPSRDFDELVRQASRTRDAYCATEVG